MTYRRYLKKPKLKRKNSISRSRNRDVSESQNSPVDHIMFLQRTIGNKAVQRMLQRSGIRSLQSGASGQGLVKRIQAKLKIGQTGDKYEQEADRVADTVMSMPENTGVRSQKSEVRREEIPVQRMCAECEEEEEQLQSKPLSDEITPLVQRQVEPEEEEEESIQAKSIYSDQPKLQRQEGPEVEEEEPNNQPVVEEEAELRRQSIEEEEEEEEEQVQTKEDFTNSNKATSNLDTNINSMRGGGKPLPKSTRAFFETRFGHDFSGVSVHTDEKATETAQAVNARAFTTGKDIVFGKGQYAPDKVEGKRLLGHELTHVVQQNPGTANLKPGLMFSFSNTIAQPFTIQRQEIPPELQTSVNHRSLTNAQLQDRYNMIAETLAKFNKTTAETAHLDREARIISDEIIRRETSRTSSLLSGRTFSTEAITRMRNFFVQNAHSANPINCIACMNKGLRLLLDDPAQRLGSQVDQTMAQLARSGRAGAAHVIEFNDSRGRMTRGVRRPHTLRQNVWDTLINMAGGDVGSSVFGLSIMDGNHSVTLTLDNSDPGAPNIYWSDQWSSRGGWQQWDRSGLNNEITRWTQRWWDNAPSNRKPRTRVTLWRLNQ